MKNLKKIGIIISLFAIILVTTPIHIVFAIEKNDMITDEYLQNPGAESSDSTAVKEQTAVGLTAWDYVKMILALLLVLMLLVWVLKFINKKSSHFQQNHLVKNLGGISLGSQKSVQVLQIGEALYIVGVGDNVELIKEITDRAEVERLLDFYNEKQMPATTAPYIGELFNKLKGKSTKSADGMHSDFGSLLNQRLSEIKESRREGLEKWKEKEHEK
ncbi:flagellar biosynthetic protein FliO [Ureibacillus sp. FSL K6-8385]|uniref:Flagellar protein n=1 Tax=Ureibacillus terrenus TaxID=118246 RepID=A0A540V4I7_9BACL|nr:flagellar biosynthetic protein FliO [Ureibacillus terrenus]MED3660409.1 flagellar biosynthetic protein FliO [Ureibacillus terrenus]MED3762565.1 flagellar biosynthetic protein FliO [Ureibacillus terrenus]TQE91628.1 flagellar protein [Ureibacillus terrenus]